MDENRWMMNRDIASPGVSIHSIDLTWSRGYHRYNGTEVLSEEDTIATEAPLTILIDGEEFATLVYTPSDTVDLVTGFLASEGMIRFVDQIESLTGGGARLRPCEAAASSSVKPSDGVQAIHRVLLREKPSVLFSQ